MRSPNSPTRSLCSSLNQSPLVSEIVDVHVWSLTCRSDEEIDHGSRFAKSLGFYEDAPWSFATPDPLAMEDIQSDGKRKKRKDVSGTHVVDSIDF